MGRDFSGWATYGNGIKLATISTLEKLLLYNSVPMSHLFSLLLNRNNAGTAREVGVEFD